MQVEGSEKSQSRFRNPFRNEAQFASRFTRWAYYKVSSELYLSDNDGVFFKLSNRIMRVIEYKHWDERLSPGQRAILTKQQQQIETDVEKGVLHELSGSFVVRGSVEREFRDGCIIQQPWKNRQCRIDAEMLLQFLGCELIILPWKTRYE